MGGRKYEGGMESSEGGWSIDTSAIYYTYLPSSASSVALVPASMMAPYSKMA